jgi:hypothetical protein
MLQGEGRHDAPTLYGCLYASFEPVSALIEQLAGLTGTSIEPPGLLDLDDPEVLLREELRPSLVATNERSTTQGQAVGLFERHAEAVGLRWWSTFESLWPNVTLFDRAEGALGVVDVQPLDAGDDVVQEAADFLGLPVNVT